MVVCESFTLFQVGQFKMLISVVSVGKNCGKSIFKWVINDTERKGEFECRKVRKFNTKLKKDNHLDLINGSPPFLCVNM